MIVMIMVMAVVIVMMKMTILLAVTTTLFSSSTVSLHDMFFSAMVMRFSSPHAPPRCRLRNSLALVLQNSKSSMTLLFFTSG